MNAVCESFQLAKDAGFKVCMYSLNRVVQWDSDGMRYQCGHQHLPPTQVVAHMMPDLPNVGFERDLEGFIVRANSQY